MRQSVVINADTKKLGEGLSVIDEKDSATSGNNSARQSFSGKSRPPIGSSRSSMSGGSRASVSGKPGVAKKK